MCAGNLKPKKYSFLYENNLIFFFSRANIRCIIHDSWIICGVNLIFCSMLLSKKFLSCLREMGISKTAEKLNSSQIIIKAMTTYLYCILMNKRSMVCKMMKKPSWNTISKYSILLVRHHWPVPQQQLYIILHITFFLLQIA